jgi:uncharacterized protein (DUF983 family)
MPATTGPLLAAILRGFTQHCPKCGQGALFRRYLKPVERCAACGEPYNNIRADDFPPYLTILVVGHLVVPGILITDRLGWSSLLQGAVWLPATAVLTLWLLPHFKGAIIGLMWTLGMSGQETQVPPAPPAAAPGRDAGLTAGRGIS